MMVNLRSVSSPLQQKQGEDSGGCFRKWWVFPQISHFDRVVHYFHPPFWGSVPLFLETPRWNHFRKLVIRSCLRIGEWSGERSREVVACWIPVTPIDLSLGGLVLCRGSNSHPGVAGWWWWGEAPNEPFFGGKKKIWEDDFNYLNFFFEGE